MQNFSSVISLAQVTLMANTTFN